MNPLHLMAETCLYNILSTLDAFTLREYSTTGRCIGQISWRSQEEEKQVLSFLS